jgi:tRNA threonylcarbamoyl adenosine modification protein YeaZ
MNQEDLSLGELGAVIASCGPGRLTGLRVGLAVAKTICMTYGIKLTAVSQFQALATAIPIDPDRRLVTLLEGGRDVVLGNLFQPGEGYWKAEAPMFSLHPDSMIDELKERLADGSRPLIVGPAALPVATVLDAIWEGSVPSGEGAIHQPTFEGLIAAGLREIASEAWTDPERVAPLYH